MNETYVEWLVKQKTSILLKPLSYLLYIVGAIVLLLGMGVTNIPFIIIGVVLGVGGYFAQMRSAVEYEYLYVDREITIDRILGKSRRKKMATFDLGKVEVMAPMNSHHLDAYTGRNYKTVDYSSKQKKEPEARYVFYYDGQQKVVFEPNEAMLKAMRFVAPHKVFTD